MHRSNFDDMTRFLALQDTITASSCHTGDVEKLGAIDHVIVCTSRQSRLGTKAWVVKETYRHVWQRIHLWLLLESTCYLHLPIMWL